MESLKFLLIERMKPQNMLAFRNYNPATQMGPETPDLGQKPQHWQL